MPKLELSQKAALLRKFYHTHKRPPSFDEIRRLCGYKSKNAAFWLVKKLIEKGVLKKDSKGKVIYATVGGIRLLGTVQAGFPSPAEEHELETIDLEPFLIKNPDKTFIIRVTGDSMIEAGIHEGDFVIVERHRKPAHNNVVVARIDGEWTLKYYRADSAGRVLLAAANSKYAPMVPRDELAICGVVTGLIRKYTKP